jgi:hypothetical protein
MIVDGVEAKEIPGFPNYAVTRDGRVWSKPNQLHDGMWRIPVRCNKSGHFGVKLIGNRESVLRTLHSLVLESWVGPRPCGMVCRHLNGIPSDNRLENLAWGTYSQNNKDTVTHGFHVGFNSGSRHPGSKLTDRDVRMVVYMWRTGIFSQAEIANIYGVGSRCVSKLVTKERWKHIWTR